MNAVSTSALRGYETIFLLKLDLTDDAVGKVKEKIRSIINRDGGKFLRFTTWGKKKTMYPIAKQPKALYIHAHYLGPSLLVRELERNLHNFDEVSRYLTKRLTDYVDPNSYLEEEELKLSGDADETTKPHASAEQETSYGDEESAIEDDMSAAK